MEQKIKRDGYIPLAYFKEALRSPLLFAIVTIGYIGMQIAQLIAPLYLRQIFNVLASRDTSSSTLQSILHIVVIIGVIYLIQWLSGRIGALAQMKIENRGMANLYRSSFEHLLRHSHEFFATQFAGTLTRRVGKYTQAFETIFDTIISSFLPTAIFVVGATVILYIHNPVLGIILGLWSVVFIIVQIFLSRLHRPRRLLRSENDSKMTGALADAISNHNTITLFAGVVDERTRFSGFVERWSKAQWNAWFFMSMIWGVQSFLMLSINIGLLYGAIIFWQRGELTIGDFIVIQTYLVGAFASLGSISFQLRGFYDALADAAEMSAILDQAHEIKDVRGAGNIHITSGNIVFSDVGFYFNEKNPVLKHFTLDVPGGQKIALVGHSGAGKSTVTKLLLRLFDVRSGTLVIDGQNILNVTQESLRRAIGFVPQEPILFHRSLMENIRYGRRNATDTEVYEAARKAHCHEFIQNLPEKYETFVGERGIKLSGGERQRIAIARAILKNAPILVLDEATSSLDSESESLIQDSLKILMEGKTVLVIAHRLSTIMNMDRIIVIDGGTIVADGTHEELLAKDGLYQKLWSIQAGGFIKDEDEEEDELQS